MRYNRKSCCWASAFFCREDLSMRKQNPQECAYCGIGTGEGDAKIIVERGIEFDVDHVIPQSFFNKSSGSPNYVKVPSCKSCNGNIKSQQDSFLKAVILMEEGVSRHPDAHELFEKAVRGLKNMPRWRREAILNAPQLPQFTESGIYVGSKTAFRLDADALNGLKMIVQGLYYDKWKEWLPIECVTRVTNNADVLERFDLAICIGNLDSDGPFVVGNEVFHFAAFYAPDDHRAGIWVMQFYGSLLLAASTDPRLSKINPLRINKDAVEAS